MLCYVEVFLARSHHAAAFDQKMAMYRVRGSFAKFESTANIAAPAPSGGPCNHETGSAVLSELGAYSNSTGAVTAS